MYYVLAILAESCDLITCSTKTNMFIIHMKKKQLETFLTTPLNGIPISPTSLIKINGIYLVVYQANKNHPVKIAVLTKKFLCNYIKLKI